MDDARLDRRRLGATDLVLTRIGFGAFKIGRNVGVKYAQAYPLPDDASADRLLRSVVDLGINYIDTAPAYGLSEERVGRTLGGRADIVISTKVGETFRNGTSHYDFSADSVRDSIERSRRLLKRETIDLVFVHSHGRDLEVIGQTDVVPTLSELKRQGSVRWIGFSGKTTEGAAAALAWADAIMVEYHLEDDSHEAVIAHAAERRVGVIVKKGLSSGRLVAAEAIRFGLGNPHVTSMVIGGLDLDHLRSNIAAGAIASR